MNICVFGLGYVGTVSAACLARLGHHVVGVDIQPGKVGSFKSGQSPVVEAGLDELIATGMEAGLLDATVDAGAALETCDVAMICVGTPSRADGSLDTRAVEAVVTQIGSWLRESDRHVHILIRSTVLPGTLRSLLLPLLERVVGRSAGSGYELSFNPEFLREGSSVKDFFEPARIVFGERTAGTAEPLAALYSGVEAPVFVTAWETAEMVKYCDNMFHAVKITFANEVGAFCRDRGIDSREVMELFYQDHKLNISHRYLRPGFAFGGSCLPKDLRAFLAAAEGHDVATPMLANVLGSNREQIERISAWVLATGATSAGLWGVAFKPGTDDLRESPFVILGGLLAKAGMTLRGYDPLVSLETLIGGNRDWARKHLPGLDQQLTSDPAALDESAVVIVGHPVDRERITGWLSRDQIVVDLTGQPYAIEHRSYHPLA